MCWRTKLPTMHANILPAKAEMIEPPKKPLLVANWKMNGSAQFNSDWVAQFNALPRVSGVEIAICPPHIYIAQVGALLKDTGIHVGAQNLNENSNGAFTGEISANMLSDCNCRYVIVGHSERRNFFLEDGKMIGRKMIRAMNSGIIPILCVGETYAQREANKTKGVIRQQLDAVFGVMGDVGEEFVVAYEPIWAIGGNKSATPEEACKVCDFIHNLLSDTAGEYGIRARVLYGGSVNRDNAQALFLQRGIDGGLIGGAALNTETFHFICEVATSRIQ